MTSEEAKAELSAFLKENRIEQREFAQMIGKSEVTISRWLNSGKPLTPANINAIRFIIWSYGKEQKIEKQHSESVSRTVTPLKLVPVLTMAQAATLGANASGGGINGFEAGQTIGFAHPKDGDFAIEVVGKSMLPWYPPGTHLLVGKDEKPKTGDRVAAMLAEFSEPVFKVFVDRGDTFELMSINRNDGVAPIVLDKMDRTSWFWCWPIRESRRDESALDEAMREFGIKHFWEG